MSTTTITPQPGARTIAVFTSLLRHPIEVQVSELPIANRLLNFYPVTKPIPDLVNEMVDGILYHREVMAHGAIQSLDVVDTPAGPIDVTSIVHQTDSGIVAPPPISDEQLLHAYEGCIINIVDKFASRNALQPADRDDWEQDLRMHLITKIPAEHRGHRAYIATALANRACSLRRLRNTQKKYYPEYVPGVTDVNKNSHLDHITEIGETPPVMQIPPPLTESEAPAIESAMQVATMLAALSPVRREIVSLRLKLDANSSDSPGFRSIARKLKMREDEVRGEYEAALVVMRGLVS